jgi:hypothetical protein
MAEIAKQMELRVVEFVNGVHDKQKEHELMSANDIHPFLGLSDLARR